MIFPDINHGSGFKIPNGHFKLGSKLHLKDFFYARVMFQNSYYANRFAFIIARHIIQQNLTDLIGNKIALIGYGKYSEQLLDKIKILLDVHLHGFQIELDFISDARAIKFIKKNKSITSEFHFIIIVPISSTLSTSAKIVDFIQQECNIDLSRILLPIFTPVIVMDEKSDADLMQIIPAEDGYTSVPEKGSIYFSFHWRKINFNSRQIAFETISGQKLLQKYFVPVFTDWHPVYDCEICFPQKFEEERPIIDTDKVSVSPNLLLANKFNFSTEPLPIVLRDKYHIYDNFRFSGKTYLHFINPNVFLAEHNGAIRMWLIGLKTKPIFNGLDFNQVVVLSTEGNFNSSFPALVNHVLFDDKANLIQFNIKTDHIENFQRFYLHEIKNAVFVVYVDDLITMGDSFSAMNSYVRMIRPDSAAIDATIIMMSRADQLIWYKVDKMLNQSRHKNSFKFIQLNVPDVGPKHMICPIELSFNNYKNLAEGSNLDTIKSFYLQHYITLRVKDELPERTKQFIQYKSKLYYSKIARRILETDIENLTPIFLERIQEANNLPSLSRNFIKFLVTHVICSIPEFPEKCASIKSFDDFVYLDTICNELKKLNCSLYDDPIENRSKIKEYVIKVLSLPPLTNYWGIRQFILSAMILEAENTCKKIIESPKHFAHYRYFKLLVKRLANLKSSYIISSPFLENLHSIFKVLNNEIRNELFNTRKEIQKKLISFCNWFVKSEMGFENFEDYSYSKVEQCSNYELMNVFNKDFEKIIEETKRVRQQGPQLALHTDTSQMQLSETEVLKYAMQMVINNEYRGKLYKDFEYFITACVNEVVFGNEAKAAKLENNLAAIKTVEGDFRHLKRILMLMNDGVFEDVMPRIKKLGILSHHELLLKINSLKNSYEYEPLFNFLKIHESSDSILLEQMPFSIFLRTWLVLRSLTEEPDNAGSDDIAGEIKKILSGIESFFPSQEMYTSLTVAYRSDRVEIDRPGEDYTYTFHTGKKDDDIPYKNFILRMLKGVQMHPAGPIQTIFETYHHNDTWNTLKGNNYFRASDSFIEIPIDFNPSYFRHLVFIRIAKFQPGADNVNNKGQGVLFLAFRSTQGDSFIDTNILRYLLLLRREISEFIKLNSENDAFRSYIEANKKIKLLSHFNHDIRENQATIESILQQDDPTPNPNEKILLLRSIINASLNQILLVEEFLRPDGNSIPLKPVKVREFVAECKRDLKRMLFARHGEGPIEDCQIIIDCAGFENVQFLYNTIIFSVIMTEIYKNIKAYLPRVNESRYCFIRIKREVGLFLEVGNVLSKNKVFHQMALSAVTNVKEDGGIELIKKIYRRKIKKDLKIFADLQTNEMIYQFQLNTDV